MEWRKALRQVVASFVGSRALYLLMVFAIPGLTRQARSFSKPWGRFLRTALFNSDGGWYYSIAVHGYAHIPFTSRVQNNWTFFPLYPYLTRWIHQLTRLPILWVGYAISSLAFLAFLLVLHSWAGRHLGRETTRLAVLLAAFVPLTPYFVAYRAASLFVLLSVLSLDAMDREKWTQAAAWGALASLARPPGILLIVPYVIAVWRGTSPGRRRLELLATGLAFLTGFFVLAIVDRNLTGNAFAFLQGQHAWGKTVGIPFVSEFRAALSMHTLTALVGVGSALIVSAIAIAASLPLIRDRRWSPGATYLLVTVLLANASTTYLAIPRFIAEVPTLYIGMAIQAERYRWQYGILVATAAMMGLYSALWILGVKGVQA